MVRFFGTPKAVLPNAEPINSAIGSARPIHFRTLDVPGASPAVGIDEWAGDIVAHDCNLCSIVKHRLRGLPFGSPALKAATMAREPGIGFKVQINGQAVINRDADIGVPARDENAHWAAGSVLWFEIIRRSGSLIISGRSANWSMPLRWRSRPLRAPGRLP
jgi:hypothetical protein